MTTMLTSSQIPSRLVAGPSTKFARRAYAVSVQPPRVWHGKGEPNEQRVFGERKTYLYHQLTRFIGRGASEEPQRRQPLLLLRHKNFKANTLSRLRREVVGAALPLICTNVGAPRSQHFSLMDDPPSIDELPQLNVVRTSIFGVALRDFANFDEKETARRIADMAGEGGGGGLAVLTLPSLDPPVLTAVLRALDRAVPKKKVEEKGKGTKGRGDEDDGHVPGRRQKRMRPILDPELTLLGALVEGRVFGVEGVRGVSKLPPLDTLRAQIVGLLSSPAMQLAMVLGQASGGQLARTLEGLKKGLEEAEKPLDSGVDP